MKMLLKAPVCSSDYRGSLPVQIGWGAWSDHNSVPHHQHQALLGCAGCLGPGEHQTPLQKACSLPDQQPTLGALTAGPQRTWSQTAWSESRHVLKLSQRVGEGHQFRPWGLGTRLLTKSRHWDSWNRSPEPLAALTSSVPALMTV